MRRTLDQVCKTDAKPARKPRLNSGNHLTGHRAGQARIDCRQSSIRPSARADTGHEWTDFGSAAPSKHVGDRRRGIAVREQIEQQRIGRSRIRSKHRAPARLPDSPVCRGARKPCVPRDAPLRTARATSHTIEPERSVNRQITAQHSSIRDERRQAVAAAMGLRSRRIAPQPRRHPAHALPDGHGPGCVGPERRDAGVKTRLQRVARAEQSAHRRLTAYSSGPTPFTTNAGLGKGRSRAIEETLDGRQGREASRSVERASSEGAKRSPSGGGRIASRPCRLHMGRRFASPGAGLRIGPVMGRRVACDLAPAKRSHLVALTRRV